MILCRSNDVFVRTDQPEVFHCPVSPDQEVRRLWAALERQGDCRWERTGPSVPSLPRGTLKTHSLEARPFPHRAGGAHGALSHGSDNFN